MHLGFIFLRTMWNKALKTLVRDLVDGYLDRERIRPGFQSLGLGNYYGAMSFPVKAISLFIDNNMDIVRWSLLYASVWHAFPEMRCQSRLAQTVGIKGAAHSNNCPFAGQQNPH